MFNFRKAQKMEIIEDGQEKYYGTKNASGRQQKYEAKVKKFLEYCNIFRKSLISQKNEIETAKNVRAYFNGSFRDYYRKSKKFGMLSRTTKVLKGIDKNLEKLGEMKLDSKGAVAEIRDAFEYKQEITKSDYIKRSIIDDKAVYGFFNVVLPKTISDIVNNNIDEYSNDDIEDKEKKIDFIKELLDNSTVKKRVEALRNKVEEIKGDLEYIKEKQNEIPYCDKIVEKKICLNNEFINKIEKNRLAISKQIEDLVSFSKGKEELLNMYSKSGSRENTADKGYKGIVLTYKKEVHKIENDINKYNEKLKKLKLQAKKAANQVEEIKNKFLPELIIINSQADLIGYWEKFKKLKFNERDFYAKIVKTVVIKCSIDISNFYSTSNVGIFSGHTSLTSVEAKGLRGAIRGYSFSMCRNLASFNKTSSYDYNIPQSVIRVGRCAFESAGKNVLDGFSANVESRSIGEFAFVESGLREINLPNATQIEMGAFKECGKLKKVILGQKRVKIYEYAFDNIPNLTVVVKNEILKNKLNENFCNVKVVIAEE